MTLRLHDNPDRQRDRLAAAATGDPEARAWLVREWTPRVFRVCRAILKDDAYARDATQDTLVKVLRRLDTWSGEGRFDSWILQIARNTCYNEFRRRGRRATLVSGEVLDARPAPAPDKDPGARIDERRDHERLHAALATLPPAYREVLELYHFQHLKYREIADVLDIPIGTVMNRIFRARKKLRAAWDAQPPLAIGAGAHPARSGSIA